MLVYQRVIFHPIWPNIINKHQSLGSTLLRVVLIRTKVHDVGLDGSRAQSHKDKGTEPGAKRRIGSGC